METVKERLLRFLRAEGISNSEFARRMGLSVAYIGAMRKSMPEERVARMVKEFPNLNRDWLLYGEGEMLKEPEEKAAAEAGAISDFMVPLLPVEAFAGSLQEWSDGVGIADCTRIMAPLRGADFAIHVTGDSMEPKIPNGTTLFIKKINDRAFIQWGTPMVIDTVNGVLVKEVRPSEAGDDYIEARSYNPNYPPIQIPKSSIFGLYRVLAMLNMGGSM